MGVVKVTAHCQRRKGGWRKGARRRRASRKEVRRREKTHKKEIGKMMVIGKRWTVAVWREGVREARAAGERAPQRKSKKNRRRVSPEAYTVVLVLRRRRSPPASRDPAGVPAGDTHNS